MFLNPCSFCEATNMFLKLGEHYFNSRTVLYFAQILLKCGSIFGISKHFCNSWTILKIHEQFLKLLTFVQFLNIFWIHQHFLNSWTFMSFWSFSKCTNFWNFGTSWNRKLFKIKTNKDGEKDDERNKLNKTERVVHGPAEKCALYRRSLF